MKEKYLKYLPSKKFTLIAGAGLVLVAAIFIIFFMSSSGENFSLTGKESNAALKVENQTITDLIENDSDGDSIADWEEALWGTDKNKKVTFNDTPDATYIENKKKELRTGESASAEEQALTETEKFAREFFTSYTAMKASGAVDNDTIQSFSSALGQKIVNPSLIDRYTENNITIYDSDNSILKQKYYENIKNLFESYQSAGLGNELDIISQELATNSTSGTPGSIDQYAKLSIIASAYQDFAKKVIGVRVPQSLTPYHLRIANSANNVGISVSGMEKIANDPIVGLSGLAQYQKYSDDLIKAVEELEAALSS